MRPDVENEVESGDTYEIPQLVEYGKVAEATLVAFSNIPE